MKKLLVILGVFLISFLCLTGCGGKEEQKYTLNLDADENIEVETYIDYEEDDLIIYMTNNNDYNIGNYEVEATYYDQDNNEIGNDFTSGFSFASGKNCVTQLRLPRDEEYNYIIPAKIDLSVKIDQNCQSIVGEPELYNDELTISYEKLGPEIEVTIKNESNVDLSTVEVIALFIKDKEPIYITDITGTLGAGESDTGTIEVPIDWEKSAEDDVLIEYDSIEFVVNEASE